MDKLDELINLNQASLILANKRAQMPKGFALKGSILDRGREVLEHAQRYLSDKAETLGKEI